MKYILLPFAYFGFWSVASVVILVRFLWGFSVKGLKFDVGVVYRASKPMMKHWETCLLCLGVAFMILLSIFC